MSYNYNLETRVKDYSLIDGAREPLGAFSIDTYVARGMYQSNVARGYGTGYKAERIKIGQYAPPSGDNGNALVGAPSREIFV